MSDHPINGLMNETMQKIRELVDVNTVVGAPIVTADGTTLVPISKVSFGFASGGGDYGKAETEQDGHIRMHFGGGSGAGASIVPVAFIVVSDGDVRILNVGAPPGTTLDRVVDKAPDVIDRIVSLFKKDGQE